MKSEQPVLAEDSYDDLAGSWVDDPGFDEAMEDMRVVDPKDWL